MGGCWGSGCLLCLREPASVWAAAWGMTVRNPTSCWSRDELSNSRLQGRGQRSPRGTIQTRLSADRARVEARVGDVTEAGSWILNLKLNRLEASLE